MPRVLGAQPTKHSCAWFVCSGWLFRSNVRSNFEVVPRPLCGVAIWGSLSFCCVAGLLGLATLQVEALCNRLQSSLPDEHREAVIGLKKMAKEYKVPDMTPHIPSSFHLLCVFLRTVLLWTVSW
jgi:hypothetical protein